ncbi:MULTISPECIES: InlB B-repeat-containing protein [unclassified Treponema]|uniref:InlB B-repeat-containing protein n=1 Tax=unclassified Treponema TaxID=2638727 RepID=UPI0020A24E08|nr:MULTISPECIES: InlB B-repeat-containing protein [unclassified Treponema]UTC67819.1 InlB B-repeat-containing protein [Treponema sp. OMZ 789]UTC70544.1 InlB B-repeat-containing protein [Treponema sp. OMZ 790]UTC73256.1 InlB B-repeat-containing protein [Treponema sp. OMZ 791]
MKQRKIVSMIGVLVFLMSVLSLLCGCPNNSGYKPPEPKNPEKIYAYISYDLSGCTSAEEGNNFWKPIGKKVEKGAFYQLAGGQSDFWKPSEVKPLNGKDFIGWSVNKDGSTKDYDFGQSIKVEKDMTFYPAYSKDAYVTVKYDFSSCRNKLFSYNEYWLLPDSRIVKGSSFTLANHKDKGVDKSGNEGVWDLSSIEAKDGRYIVGWSKSAAGNTKDYDFGQSIIINEDTTLYPAFSKYKVGDMINGKTVIYLIRKAITEESLGDSFDSRHNKIKNFDVKGSDGTYITIDIDFANASTHCSWTNKHKDVMTSTAIGAGKKNTEQIIEVHKDDTYYTDDTYYVTRYCKQKAGSKAFVPSLGEAFLIVDAIKNWKIDKKKFPKQTANSFGEVWFWTSSQTSVDKAKIVTLSDNSFIHETHIERDEEKKIINSAYLCPVYYFDKEGNAIE